MYLQHEEMSKGRRVYSFSQGMHIVLDTECSLHTGCPQITQLFLVFRCFLFWSRQTQQLPTIGVGPRLPCGARTTAAFSRDVTIRRPSSISTAPRIKWFLINILLLLRASIEAIHSLLASSFRNFLH